MNGIAVTQGVQQAEFMQFAIHQAPHMLGRIDNRKDRNEASQLISKMYGWRGYVEPRTLNDDPHCVTLTASDKNQVVGTLTLGLDSPAGILADEIFKPEVDAYRARGAKVCEITKLAFDVQGRTKESMASLFHLSVIYARDLHNCTHIFIEVNPRHRRFYERMLGFKRLGELKSIPRVNAPANLLCVSLDYVTEQVQKFGGGGPGAQERSFYPLFFTAQQEAAIIQLLKGQ